MKTLKIPALMIKLLFTSSLLSAQTPELRHVFDIRAEISAPLDLGDTPTGHKIVIPITGGEIKGEVNGKILNGGADYQSIDRSGTRTALKAIYTIVTNDSVLINVVNEGICYQTPDEYYFLTNPRFECKTDSKYSWLNDRIFLCRPVKFEDGAIVLRVWEAR